MIIKELTFVDPHDYPPDKVFDWEKIVTGLYKEIKVFVIFRHKKTGKSYIDKTVCVAPSQRGAAMYGKYGFLNRFPTEEITHWCPIPEV